MAFFSISTAPLIFIAASFVQVDLFPVKMLFLNINVLIQGGSWYVKDTGEVWQGSSSLEPNPPNLQTSLGQNSPNLQTPPRENYYDLSQQPSFVNFPGEDYLTFFGKQPSKPLAKTLLGRFAEDVIFVTLLTTFVFTILLSIVVVGMGVVICKIKSQAIEAGEEQTFPESFDPNNNIEPAEDILSQFDALTTTLNERLVEVRTLLELRPDVALQILSKKQQQTSFPKPAERNVVS